MADGKAYIAQADDAGQQIRHDFNHDAAFLVYGKAGRWKSVPVPENIVNLTSLEQGLQSAASPQGIDVNNSFPFKIETATSKIDYHIISNTDGGYQVTRPHRELMRFFTIESETAVLMGVFSASHPGVFTHHGQRTHIHLVSSDGQRSGHVDDFTLGPNTMLYLPE